MTAVVDPDDATKTLYKAELAAYKKASAPVVSDFSANVGFD